MKKNENYEDEYMNIGDCYRNLDNYNEALKFYKDQIEATGGNGLIYNSIGLLYEINLKDYKNAIENYQKAINIDPRHTDAYKNIGNCLIKSSKNYSDAIKYYKKQRKYIEDKRELSFDIAEAYEKMGCSTIAKIYYESAISYLISAIRNKEKSVCNYSKLGKCCDKIGNREMARDNFLKAISLATNRCDYSECHFSYYEMANIYFKEKNYEEALKHINKAIEIKEDEEYLIEKKMILNFI